MSRQGVLTRCLALGRLAADSNVPTRLQGCTHALRAAALLASRPHSSSSSSSSSSGAQGSGGWAAVAAATAGATAAASLLLLAPGEAECAAAAGAAYPAPEHAAPRRWMGLPGWLTGWVPGWGGGSREADSGLEASYLQAIKDDPRVAVVMAFALPFLSLSFGFTPSQVELEAAGAAVEPQVSQLRPWEVAVLMWGAARLGYTPGPHLLAQLQQRAAGILRAPPGSPEAFSPQEACMAAWALSALQAQTPALWQAEMAFVAACPSAALDEVALIHLWQAGMFTDRAVVTSRAPSLGSSANAIVPRMRSAADEARATLASGHLPLPLIARCEQAYRTASRQAGFDGPYLIELTMLRLLVTIYQELGDSVAYAPFFEDLQLLDLQHARQLLADPYLLAKFKGEIAEKRARQNNFTRTLADVSRTLRGMRLHHTVQVMGLDISYHGGSSYPHDHSHPGSTGSLRLGRDAYMTRDQVERLLEQTVMGWEKRLAVAQAAVAAASAAGFTSVAVAPNGGATRAPQQGAQQAQQGVQQAQQGVQQRHHQVVKSLKPLLEMQMGPEGRRGAAQQSLPPPATTAGGSMHGGGDSMHGGGGGGMPRIRSLSQMQQHMTRAYTSGAGSGEGSNEGTRHSHMSWADEAGKP